MVAEHVLTCSQSHNTTISLMPFMEGPVVEAEDEAQISVQDVFDAVVAHINRDSADTKESNL
jgi:hypothetical protein